MAVGTLRESVAEKPPTPVLFLVSHKGEESPSQLFYSFLLLHALLRAFPRRSIDIVVCSVTFFDIFKMIINGAVFAVSELLVFPLSS